MAVAWCTVCQRETRDLIHVAGPHSIVNVEICRKCWETLPVSHRVQFAESIRHHLVLESSHEAYEEAARALTELARRAQAPGDDEDSPGDFLFGRN